MSSLREYLEAARESLTLVALSWFHPRLFCRAPLHLVPAPSCLTGLRRPLANPPTLETGITTA